MPKVTTTKALAARKSWQERAETWRNKINTAKIINRLEEFVDSYISPKGYVLMPIKPTADINAVIDQDTYRQLVDAAPKNIGIEMTPSQVKASQVLLDRVMPTLSASEIVHKKDSVSPEELIEDMRKRYGDEFANQLAKDYIPQEDETTVTHDPGHA